MVWIHSADNHSLLDFDPARRGFRGRGGSRFIKRNDMHILSPIRCALVVGSSLFNEDARDEDKNKHFEYKRFFAQVARRQSPSMSPQDS